MRRLINELCKLPSVGEKSASRLAYHLISTAETDARALADAIGEARDKIRLCRRCFALSESELCAICLDQSRLHSTVCVVEKPADVLAIERSGRFRGGYHVLHGLWSPIRGITPEQTKIVDLLERLRRSAHPNAVEQSLSDETANEKIEELIVATSTTVEGDATALYIANAARELGVEVSRIAQGLPKGGELEYADEVTLSHALDGRRQL